MVLFEVESRDKWLKAFEDPHYFAVIKPDEDYFLDGGVEKGVIRHTWGKAARIVTPPHST